MDPQLLQAVEDAKAALDQAVTLYAAATSTVANDQQVVATQAAKVAAAQVLLDSATTQVTNDQVAVTTTQASVKSAAQAEVSALQALISSLG